MAVAVVAATDAAIQEAGRRLAAGDLVAFPTETVYGLGADATSDAAVARLFDAKGRPRFNPLIIHVANPPAAAALVVLDGLAERLATAFWPGPLTLVGQRTPDCPVSYLACAGLATIAVRVPAHPVARALIRAAARPIAGPSANRSGRLSATRPEHVAADFDDRVALVLDGGPTPLGLESTVVEVVGGRATILRPGALTEEALMAVAGPLERDEGTEGHPRSPGRLASHYAPERPLRMNATSLLPGEAGLAFGQAPAPSFADAPNLSVREDLVEAAANLFAMLRALDQGPATGIAVAPVPEEGLGRAINDRLRRAAEPKGLC